MSKVGSAVPKWDRTFSACEEKKGEGGATCGKEDKDAEGKYMEYWSYLYSGCFVCICFDCGAERISGIRNSD